jgi:hypothetical protein
MGARFSATQYAGCISIASYVGDLDRLALHIAILKTVIDGYRSVK